MDEQILTSVSAVVDPSRDSELVDGFNVLLGGALPDGLLRTELLRGQDRTWRIQSLWRDRAALMTARETGERPAALVLFGHLLPPAVRGADREIRPAPTCRSDGRNAATDESLRAVSS